MIFVWAPPRTPLGELTAHRSHPQLDLRETSKGKEWNRRGSEGKAGNGEEGQEEKGKEIMQF